MKVIFTGFSKCGTKSMAEALRELGLNVYDFMEHYENHYHEWMKILTVGGTKEDFYEMYKDVDAVTDQPAFHFWEEILEAFPDAKIIHCERSSEDSWWDSFYRQIISADQFLTKLIGRLSPSWWPLGRFANLSCSVAVTHVNDPLFGKTTTNELLSRMAYRRHNDYLRKKAPKDQLLIWKFGDGYGPICQFLNVPVPDKPYPHSNKNCTLWDDLLKTNWTLQRITIEGLSVLFILTCLSAYGLFKLHSGPGLMSVLNIPKSIWNSLTDLF